MIKHYDGAYGHTYYYNADGILVGQPTMADGTFEVNEDEAIEVEDFVEPLTEAELAEVTNNLK